MSPTAEKHTFQAEVNEVLSLVVNSLYSHREVFLRELISNSADALDQLNFRALTEHELLGDDKELRIELIRDEAAGTLTIRDNGVGMTHDELVQNLGTIARSGSKKLMQSLDAEQKKDVSLIGQFGVGFYSAFLVADSVTVTSKKAGSDEAWTWQSEAKGRVRRVRSAERASRGTDITLHLKEDAKEYLQEWPVRDRRAQVQRLRALADHDGGRTHDRRRRRQEDRPKENVSLNQARALWTRSKNEIEDEQYNASSTSRCRTTGSRRSAGRTSRSKARTN